MKKITQVITFIMIVVMLFGLGQQQVNAADNITKSTVADSETINNWHAANAFDDSTKNVGRIWTDKSVSTGDVTLTGRQDESQSATIKKGADSDFLVGLSVLSATAKIVGETTVPLDIVLVLDVSGSMEDPSGPTDRTKRIDRLKEAVNDFIDSSAKENDKRADENKQSRIAVIKFAGEESDKIGNETYRKGQYSYNYTQVVSGYKAYTSSDKSELQNKVNALRPAGATLADNAMELTQKLVNQSKTDEASNENRKNVKRVVIFFTDGVPASVIGSDVAGGHSIAIYKQIARAVQLSKLKEFYEPDQSQTITITQAFYHATKEAGSVFGKVGSFEKGYQFNALVIDTMEDSWVPLTAEERLERFCYIGDDRNIRARFIDGKKIHFEN